MSLETRLCLSIHDHPTHELEVARFLRNHGSQFLYLGNRATRIGVSIPEKSRFTTPIFGESCQLYSVLSLPAVAVVEDEVAGEEHEVGLLVGDAVIPVGGRQVEGQPREAAAGDEDAHRRPLRPIRVERVQLFHLGRDSIQLFSWVFRFTICMKLLETVTFCHNHILEPACKVSVLSKES